MNAKEVMRELKAMGSAQTRKIYKNHGAPDNFFGVKVADMKKIVKKVKQDQGLAEKLFATGNGDAQYLAGLIADPQTVTKKVLRDWEKTGGWYMVTEYAVAGVAAESPHGWDLGLKWIESKNPRVACAGWSTLSGVVAVVEDAELDLKKIKAILTQIKKTIHASPNRVRHTMNSFVISVGCYVTSLSGHARKVAEAIGKVEVDMGGTACKVPFAPEYIDNVVKMGDWGKSANECAVSPSGS